MASDSAIEEATSKVKGGAGWLLNQFHPFGENGKLSRTLMVGAGIFYGSTVFQAIGGGAGVLSATFTPLADGGSTVWESAKYLVDSGIEVAGTADVDRMGQGFDLLYNGITNTPTPPT